MKPSNTLEKSGVQDRFLHSERLAGSEFFGMMVTISVAQGSGQIPCLATRLYMVDSGMAIRSLQVVTMLGGRSPGTCDFGFLNALSLPAI